MFHLWCTKYISSTKLEDSWLLRFRDATVFLSYFLYQLEYPGCAFFFNKNWKFYLLYQTHHYRLLFDFMLVCINIFSLKSLNNVALYDAIKINLAVTFLCRSSLSPNITSWLNWICCYITKIRSCCNNYNQKSLSMPR